MPPSNKHDYIKKAKKIVVAGFEKKCLLTEGYRVIATESDDYKVIYVLLEVKSGLYKAKVNFHQNPAKVNVKKCSLHGCGKKFDKNPQPVIFMDDFSGFDGFITLILLQKAMNIDLRLLVVNQCINNIGPGVNNVYNILAWLGNTTTKVVTGAYFSPTEVQAGPYPLFSATTEDLIGGIYPVETSERVGQVAQPISKMFFPPLWNEQGSTLYGTVGMIPVNTDPERQYKSVAVPPFTFIPSEDEIAATIEEVRKEGKKVTIINTGTHTDLGKFFTKYGTKYDNDIDLVLIMGGGFFNYGFDQYASDEEKAKHPDEANQQRWAGNIFTSDIYYLSPLVDFGAGLPYTNPTLEPPPGYEGLIEDWPVKPPFFTEQEVNIFADPLSAQIVFDHLHNNSIRTIVVPTDATDSTLIANNLDSLKCSPTPEGQYVYALIQGIRDFEGEGFDFVTRAWDIVAAIALLDPKIVDPSGNKTGRINVVQLGSIDELAKSACGTPEGKFQLKSPYNVLQYNPQYGKTTLEEGPSSITVVTKVDVPRLFEDILNRLNSKINSALSPTHY